MAVNQTDPNLNSFWEKSVTKSDTNLVMVAIELRKENDQLEQKVSKLSNENMMNWSWIISYLRSSEDKGISGS